MSRRTTREAIVTALSALNFQTVYEGAPRDFGGVSPVAVVLSRGTDMEILDRGASVAYRHRFTVTVYVRCDSGQEAAAEDALDTLVQATIDALRPLTFGVPGTDAEPDSFPLRSIDGVLYRVERIALTIEEFSSGI